MSDFAEHWAARLMPEMRRRARLEAIAIVTADEPEANWDTFDAGLAELERYAHRLGASHMPEAYQRALHDELRRELVVSITAVLAPWHETRLRAEMTDQWSRAFAAWAANNPDAAAAWTRKTTGEPAAQLSAPSGQLDRNNVPPGRCNYPECGGGCEGCQPP
jgi:hypothetical protein